MFFEESNVYDSIIIMPRIYIPEAGMAHWVNLMQLLILQSFLLIMAHSKLRHIEDF